MDWKFSANASFFGAQRDRFGQYQPDRTLEEKFALVTQVKGITGIELKYPADFKDPVLVRQLLEKHELSLSAVNANIKNVEFFRFGALSARSEETRSHAVEILHEAMDVAASFGIDLVTICPLADGYDYPFQVDHVSSWGRFIETVRNVVSHRSDVKLLLEYQPHEPHAKIMLNNVGKLLYVFSEVGAPNIGANLDIGHSLAAGESPAEAAALLAGKNRLFYIHTNDNTADGGDWDMISGSVHFWQWLELLYTLSRLDYNGWFSGDIAPKHMGPADAYRTNIIMIQRMTKVVGKIGLKKIDELLSRDGNPAEMFEYLSSCFM
jgi:xylose isomerase